MNIKKDDRVLVQAGREKGKVGKVLKVDPVKQRAVVEKVNMIKRHTRAGQGGQGGIVEREAPLAISNLMLLCPKCNQPGRVSRKKLENGKVARFCGKCGEYMDN
ncbi:MAG: 50S ribosomal protein L24 [Desulfarculaceae bacterium]|nr:50S ribosomal protein L24 [Desulfarculaceae bacterium]MCF8071422.1 50S ribosomal protein L24 [Desulfarculaceae bacterium]MCF8101747.1 50S ribosomal protein L24 [Desulfarculaceae bacterium]